MKVKVSVYKADDGSFWCHTERNVYGTGLNGCGNTVAEAKQDLMVCLEEAKEDYLNQGKTPYQVDFEYIYDLQSFFEFFSVFKVTEEARRAGINTTLMRQYILDGFHYTKNWILNAVMRIGFFFISDAVKTSMLTMYVLLVRILPLYALSQL